MTPALLVLAASQDVESGSYYAVEQTILPWCTQGYNVWCHRGRVLLAVNTNSPQQSVLTSAWLYVLLHWVQQQNPQTPNHSVVCAVFSYSTLTSVQSPVPSNRSLVGKRATARAKHLSTPSTSVN